MSDTNPAPQNPPNQRNLMDEKRAQWDAITHKREEMIAAEKARAVARGSADVAREKRDQEAFHAEVEATQARSEEREEWRQEQHTKREEEEEWRKEKEAERLRLLEEEKKKEEARAEQKAYLMNLHKVAIAHKIRDKRQAIEDEAVREIKVADDMADRHLHTLDEDTQRTLNHLESERQRKLTQTRVEDQRRRKDIEERARVAIAEAHNEWKKADSAARHMQDRMEAGDQISAARFAEGQAKMRIDGERRRDLLTLDEHTQATLFAIDAEAKHLKDEVIKNAGTKKMLIERQEDKKKQEAERRKENFEKWLKDV